MEGYYPVSYQGKPVGKVQVLRKGLYYSFHCRCRMESDIVCRLIAKWANGWENLGIPVPEGDGLELNRRLPAKRLGEEHLEFMLIPHEQDMQMIISGAKANEKTREKMRSDVPAAAEPAEELTLPEEIIPGTPGEQYPEAETEMIPSAKEENTDTPKPSQGEEGAAPPAAEGDRKNAVPEPAGAFYPIETDRPFEHLEELEQGILTSRDGQTGVFIPEEGQRDGQMFKRSPTGQWSEPMTSE